MSVQRHTAYNVAGAVVPLLATFVTLPLYLRLIGEERYGILVIVWTVLGYFGLFDLGLGVAVTNRIAAFKDRTAAEREEVFWTALVLNLALGCVAALLLWGVGAVLFQRLIDVPGPLAAEVYTALPWMAVAFPLLLTTSVMTGALMGREEFLAQNAVGVVTGLLIQVAPLAVAWGVGPSLPALVIAVLVVRVLGGGALFALCVRRLPVGFRPRPARSHAHALFSFGGWVAVTGIVGPLLSTLDRVIIGAVSGARAVTYYTVPFNLTTRISILPGSLSSALFPRFSSASPAEADALSEQAIRTLVVVLTPLIVLGLLIMEPVLHVWVGAAFAAQAASVGEILAVGMWANCLATTPYTVLQAQGRPDLVAKFHLVELVPYLVLLWFGLQWWGVVGAALAWSVRVWADGLLLFGASRIRYTGVMAGGLAALV
ncbi:MAG TPA: flippase, partial [Rhodothermales bacterium]|nr:flippase [Rhodothermales bacterium]